jgi:outer membrane protein assembly factor BamE
MTRVPGRPALKPRLGVCCLFLLVLSGCSSEGDRKLPGVYRVDVQQGNIIEQEMLDKLRPGMDRNQVRFIMGTPAVTDPFHADRWDYLFTLSKGGRTREQRHVILYFKNDKLTHITGDVVQGARKSPGELTEEARASTVEVPLESNKPGLFSRMFNALPFVGDDNTRKTPEEPESTERADTAQEPGASGETPAGEPPEAQVEQELPSP